MNDGTHLDFCAVVPQQDADERRPALLRVVPARRLHGSDRQGAQLATHAHSRQHGALDLSVS